MITVRVADRFVQADSLSWSSVDPGGFEVCNFVVHETPIRLGDDVLVMDGMEVCFHGFVEEPGPRSVQGRASYNVTAVGYGARLRDHPFSMIYTDRDLNRWQPMSLNRSAALIDADWGPQDFSISANTNGGNPGLSLELSGPWLLTSRALIEAWYDAGPDNLVGEVAGTWNHGVNVSAADTNWREFIILTTTDIATSNPAVTGNLLSASTVNTSLDSPGGTRYAIIQHYYVTGPAGGDNTQYGVYWTNLRVYGPHGIARTNGPTGEGLLASDIASDAIGRSQVTFNKIIDSSSYIVLQSAYYEPVPGDQIIDDMAKLVGYHWGVWEPLSLLTPLPTVYFTRPPLSATTTASYQRLASVDLTERMSETFNNAKILWSDVSGTTAVVDLDVANTRLPDNLTRTLLLDIGIAESAIAAQAVGGFFLALSQLGSRVSGSAELPAVMDDGRPSHLLRPGRDRIRITGLPTFSTMSTLSDTPDTFRIRRLSVAVQDGTPRSSIEFDYGADLTEVLQARLNIAGTLSGVSS